MAVHGNSRRFSRIININEFYLAVSLSIIHSQVLAVSVYEEPENVFRRRVLKLALNIPISAANNLKMLDNKESSESLISVGRVAYNSKREKE